MWAVSGQPLHISGLTQRAPAEWLPLSAVPPWEENTHAHYNRLSCCCSVWRHSHLWLGLWDGRRDVWNISLKSWRLAAAQWIRESRPAVHLISPMGLLAGKAWLIWDTCATSCLSHCLAFCGAEWRRAGGGYACAFGRVVHVWRQLGSTLAF